MTARDVRLCILGCGTMATAVHLRNARRIPGATITAVADPLEAARLRARRLAPGATCLESLDEVLARNDVDAVVVATPSPTHAAIALRVLETRRHLYLEKPVAVTADEADRLEAAAAEVEVVAAVGFNRRFHPLVRRARQCLLAGELGPVVSVRSVFEEPLSNGGLPDWKRRRATGGGAPLDLATHHVDLVRHFLGVELVARESQLASVRSELDDCTLRFRGGPCEVVIGCSFVRGRRDEVTLEDADGRALTIDRYAGTLAVDGRRRRRGLVPTRARAVVRPVADVSYLPALRAFVDRIRGVDVALPTIADGTASVRAVVAAESRARPSG